MFGRLLHYHLDITASVRLFGRCSGHHEAVGAAVAAVVDELRLMRVDESRPVQEKRGIELKKLNLINCGP